MPRTMFVLLLLVCRVVLLLFPKTAHFRGVRVPMECFNKPSYVFSQLSDENDLTALIPFGRRLSQVSLTLVRHWNFFFS